MRKTVFVRFEKDGIPIDVDSGERLNTSGKFLTRVPGCAFVQLIEVNGKCKLGKTVTFYGKSPVEVLEQVHK